MTMKCDRCGQGESAHCPGCLICGPDEVDHPADCPERT